jgi:hypothetical protein
LFSDSIATIVRLQYLVQLGDPSADQLQMDVVNLKALLLSNIELALAVFAGSLPALRPLLKYVPLLRTATGHNGDAVGELERGCRHMSQTRFEQ